MEKIMQSNRPNYALSLQIIKRAAIAAIVIGSVLTLINQFDAIFGPAKLQILPLALVYLTPFLVVSLSQIIGAFAARKEMLLASDFQQGFFGTMLSHDILIRAVALGLAAGGTNTFIVVIANIAAGQDISQLPVALILQALVLPIIFGAMSQTLAFRRTISQSV